MKACKGPEAPKASTFHYFYVAGVAVLVLYQTAHTSVGYLEKGWERCYACRTVCAASAGGLYVTERACK